MDAQQTTPREQAGILGGVLWLCRFSSLHMNYPVGLLLERVAPSIELNQYRYYEDDDGTPIGFCNWALLSDELLAEALKGEDNLKPADWRSGSNLFFPEFIAPFGHCMRLVRDLRRNILPPNQRIWSMRGMFDEDGAGVPRIHRFCNVQFDPADDPVQSS